MTGFDGELYLRLFGERTLLSGENQHSFNDPLVEQARALTTVGAVGAAAAQRVVTDYARARALRGQGGQAYFGPLPTTVPPPRRIVSCRHVIKTSPGDLELRYAVLSQAETRLAITFRSSAQIPPGTLRRPSPMPVGITTTPAITVTDDRGTTVTSSAFSGGGSTLEWRGFLTLQPALAPDTAWIELYGERVELGAGLGDRAITIEAFPETDRAERYLVQCLTSIGHRPHARSLSDALEALTAAGLIDPADPEIATILAIDLAVNRFGGGYVLTPTQVAEPWASLLTRRGNTGGPVGCLFVGAVTPVFDRVSAALLDLTSADDGFQCDFELVGPIELGMAGSSTLDGVLVTFSALDDCGNFYLGQLGNWSGGGGTASGVLEFWPALDPKAAQLDLVLTTDRARAVITVPLTWDAAR